MRTHFPARVVAIGILAGAWACAGGMAREDDTAAAPQDTTEVQNPPGYRGMERDTAQVAPNAQEPVDTFLQDQGTGTPTDTAGYSGLEQIDTTGQTGAGHEGQDTSGTAGYGQDTSGTAGYGQDTTTTPGYGEDTTGYGQDAGGVPGADTNGMPSDTGLSDTTDTSGEWAAPQDSAPR